MGLTVQLLCVLITKFNLQFFVSHSMIFKNLLTPCKFVSIHFSVSSFSSTTSSLNPSRAENGAFTKARHARNAAERSEIVGKNYFRANPIQVMQNGDETPTDLNRSISMR